MKDFQKQIDELNRKVDQLSASSDIPFNVEYALRERLEFKKIPTITTGTDTPTNTKSIPLKVGDIYIDTANSKAYFATGNTSVSDYKILN